MCKLWDYCNDFLRDIENWDDRHHKRRKIIKVLREESASSLNDCVGKSPPPTNVR